MPEMKKIIVPEVKEQSEPCNMNQELPRGATHEHLWTLVQKLPTDFSPYGQRDRDADWGPDCSCGCKYFHPLAGERGFDWGVCTNSKSPRAGMLTFEHMGCKEFEAGEQSEE